MGTSSLKAEAARTAISAQRMGTCRASRAAPRCNWDMPWSVRTSDTTNKEQRPLRNGALTHGFDPQARLDHGYNSYDQVTQAAKDGICVSSGGWSRIHDNTVSGAVNGINVQITKQQSIGSNTLVSNRNGALDSGSDNLWLGNRIYGNANYGLALSRAIRPVLGLNWIGGNGNDVFGIPRGAMIFGGYSDFFANLGDFAAGSEIFCRDCRPGSTCAPRGTGALAKRVSGSWVCN